MKRFATAEQLLACFRELDRDEVQLPPDMTFPLLVRDYLSWIEPSGHRPDVNDLRESLGKSQRLNRVLEKMSEFARENLF